MAFLENLNFSIYPVIVSSLEYFPPFFPSTDTLAPMAFLPAEKFPLLFAIVFGEGVLNDVVSILLSTATAGSPALPSPGELLGLVSYYLFTSLFMGVFFGLGISLLYKYFEDLHHHVHKPVTLMVLLNYVCYVTTEMFEFSAIFLLFVCALIGGHYGVWSMSKKLGGEVDSVVGAKCAYLGHRIEEVVLRCDGVLDHVGKADSALETATGRCENRGARLEIAARRCEAALARAGSPAAHARASPQFAGAPDGYASSPWTTPARQASPPIQSSSDATAGAAVSSQRRTDGC